MATASKKRGRRITVNVEDFKQWVNQQLERTDNFADDKFKAGLCSAVEHVLQTANRYHGYTDNNWIRTGYQEWLAAGQPDYPDKDKYVYGPTGQQYNRHYY
jgi:hypothetical protein